MKYIDEFRSAAAVERLAGEIRALAGALERPVRIMEVCGSHTMAIGRFALREMLPESVSLLSGPGCPVCVTGSGYLDAAKALALRGVTVATFGDLLRVPGSGRATLADVRARGGAVEIVYSPEQALELARANPAREVVFLGIGFESTAAAILAAVDAADEENIRNFRVLTAFKQMVPALEYLLADPALKLDGLLLPPHVSSIIGSAVYTPVLRRSGVAGVVCGFEPADILGGIAEVLRRIRERDFECANFYRRGAKPDGNRVALAFFDRYLESAAAGWRGLGEIPGSGLKFRTAFANFDAAKYYNLDVDSGSDDPRCRCGAVLRGLISPAECGMFARGCTPDHPVGACMVSEEGACAARYRYGK